jgi:hypothetical protein
MEGHTTQELSQDSLFHEVSLMLHSFEIILVSFNYAIRFLSNMISPPS